MRIALIAPLAGIALLAACNSGPDEEEAVAPQNNVAEMPVPEAVDEAPVQPPVVNQTQPPAAPAPRVSDEEQMIDDADATGLTRRLPEAQPDTSPEMQLPINIMESDE